MTQRIELQDLPNIVTILDNGQIVVQSNAGTQGPQGDTGGVQPWPVALTHLAGATPTTTTSFPMTGTGDMLVGQGIKIKQHTVTAATYHMVTLVDSTHIEVCGPPLLVGDPIDNLWIMPSDPVVEFIQVMHGPWDSTVQDVLENVELVYDLWEGPIGYLVSFQAVQNEADAVANGKLNVRLDGDLVGTALTGKGIQLGASGIWVINPADAIDPATYAISRNSEVELACTEAGDPGTGRFLTARLTFVTL